MIGSVFVNPILSTAIDQYLKFKDKPDAPEYNSFLVVVIRTLVSIYSELDIINPYITQNETNMGGLDFNLKKYGYSQEEVDNFEECFVKYEEAVRDNIIPNLAFINIQKHLINMFLYKYKANALEEGEEQRFKLLIYLKDNPNNIFQAYRNKYLDDKDELDKYYIRKKQELSHNYRIVEVKRSLLMPEAYKILGYQMDQVNNLGDTDLRDLNNHIYEFFMIDSNAQDKDEILEKAVNFYKKYGNRVTSGNGFVDMLLLLSVIATVGFIILLFKIY